jgi:alcohol dehydrogenase YqhD (iron-dependent ADH family)
MDLCEQLGIKLVWAVGGGKVQSSSTLVSASGMVVESITDVDGVDVTPSRVEVVSSADVAKNSDY